MKVLANGILVLGFCVGTVGAAGFTAPPESAALPLLAGGLAGVAVGGTMLRRARRAGTGTVTKAGGISSFREQVEAVRSRVAALDEAKGSLSRDEVRARIDELLRNEYFDLTSRHEELQLLVGFTAYARVWEGVATAERLLSRTWSLATDGYLEEACSELPLAHENLERAAKELAALSG